MFKGISNNIEEWIISGGADNIRLPARLNLKDYKKSMLAALGNYHISFTENFILVDGVEKTCKNYVDENLERQIICNLKRFEGTYSSSIDDAYILIHHEFAGLAKVELNKGQDSDYEISNQISAYLKFEVVKKLPVKTSKNAVNPYESRLLEEIPAGSVLTFRNLQIDILAGTTRAWIFGDSNDRFSCYIKYAESKEDRSFTGDIKMTLNSTPKTFASEEIHGRDSVSVDVFYFSGKTSQNFVNELWCRDGLLSGLARIGEFQQALETENAELVIAPPKPIKNNKWFW
jgi:hypothetical protein